MKLIVKYFGMIAEWIGTHENEIDFSGSTVADLKSQLEASCSELKGKSYQVAVNHKISDNDLALNESDKLAILPPFAGG
jgi:molybdopterin converting factor small subunit